MLRYIKGYNIRNVDGFIARIAFEGVVVPTVIGELTSGSYSIDVTDTYLTSLTSPTLEIDSNGYLAKIVKDKKVPDTDALTEEDVGVARRQVMDGISKVMDLEHSARKRHCQVDISYHDTLSAQMEFFMVLIRQAVRINSLELYGETRLRIAGVILGVLAELDSLQPVQHKCINLVMDV